MTNPRTNVSGKTRLLGPAGAPVAEDRAPAAHGGQEPPSAPEPQPQDPAPVERQRSPRAWRQGVPLGHGKHAAELIEARRQLAEARRCGDNEGQRAAARRLREMGEGR